LFPLTLALSLGERGSAGPFFRSSGVTGFGSALFEIAERTNRNTERYNLQRERSTTLPLPKGEGRGEGKGIVRNGKSDIPGNNEVRYVFPSGSIRIRSEFGSRELSRASSPLTLALSLRERGSAGPFLWSSIVLGFGSALVDIAERTNRKTERHNL
jgi:hypothetical protein